MSAFQDIEGLRVIANICRELGVNFADVLHMLFHEVEFFAIANQIGVDKVVRFLERWSGVLKSDPQLADMGRLAELRAEFLKRYQEVFKPISQISLQHAIRPEEIFSHMVERGLVSKEEMDAYTKVTTLFSQCIRELYEKRRKELG